MTSTDRPQPRVREEAAFHRGQPSVAEITENLEIGSGGTNGRYSAHWPHSLINPINSFYKSVYHICPLFPFSLSVLFRVFIVSWLHDRNNPFFHIPLKYILLLVKLECRLESSVVKFFSPSLLPLTLLHFSKIKDLKILFFFFVNLKSGGKKTRFLINSPCNSHIGLYLLMGIFFFIWLFVRNFQWKYKILFLNYLGFEAQMVK